MKSQGFPQPDLKQSVSSRKTSNQEKRKKQLLNRRLYRHRANRQETVLRLPVEYRDHYLKTPLFLCPAGIGLLEYGLNFLRDSPRIYLLRVRLASRVGVDIKTAAATYSRPQDLLRDKVLAASTNDPFGYISTSVIFFFPYLYPLVAKQVQ